MREAVARLGRRLAVLVRFRAHQAELHEEMALHRDMRVNDFLAQGMSRVEAEAAASRAMGNMTVERESSRSVWAVRWADDLVRDAAYALRSLARTPLFTLVAIVGLTGGLSFSIAAFSAFNALVLRGWPVDDPATLTALYATPRDNPTDRRQSGFSYDEMRLLSTRAQTLTDVFAWERARSDLTGGVTAAFVTPGYLRALGVHMAAGRDFRAEDDRVGAPTAVAVVSDRWWRTRMNAARDAVGSVVRVSGVPFTVIGVAEPGFDGTDRGAIDAWVPLTAMPLVRPRDRMSRTALAHRDVCCVQVAARLADGATRDAAAREVADLLAQARRPGIDTIPRVIRAHRFSITGTSGPGVDAEIAPVFALLFGGVALVLVLACANVANLLLARAAVREREIGIRLALGASRGRLVRQLMTESLVLSLIATIPAIVLAQLIPPFIIQSYAIDDMVFDFTADGRVMAVAVALSVGSCMMFGLVPALQASKPRLMGARLPLRTVFLSTQVAVCLVLLVCAGLFLRSVQAGRTLPMGFEPSAITELTIVPPANEDESARTARFIADLPGLMRDVGVARYALASQSPFSAALTRVQLGEHERRVRSVEVSASYIDVAQLTLLAGRAFRDNGARADEIVINANLADSLGGVANAVGRTLVVDSVPRTVVGVVANARDAGGVREFLPALYRPPSKEYMPHLLLRASTAEAQRVARELRRRDASIGVAVRPYSWYVERNFGVAKGAATIAGALGVLALGLAAAGMFGVFACWVQQRRREIGIRLALGAARGDVLRLVLRVTGRALGWGLLAGLVLAVLAAQALRSNLYGLPPLDPVSFGTALGVLLLSALLATLWPAWSATRVTPMESIRSD